MFSFTFLGFATFLGFTWVLVLLLMTALSEKEKEKKQYIRTASEFYAAASKGIIDHIYSIISV